MALGLMRQPRLGEPMAELRALDSPGVEKSCRAAALSEQMMPAVVTMRAPAQCALQSSWEGPGGRRGGAYISRSGARRSKNISDLMATTSQFDF